MKSLKGIFFILLFFAAGFSSAASLCSLSFQNLKYSDYVQARLSESLSPFFDRVPDRVGRSLMKKVSQRILKGRISELDFHNLSLKYYQALQGNTFFQLNIVKKYLNTFSRVKTEEHLQSASEFYQTLEGIMQEFGVELKSTSWIKMKLRSIHHQVPVSWIKFVSLNGAIQWGIYNATGNLLPFPATLPQFSKLDLSSSLTGRQRAAVYYEKMTQTLISTYFAVMLATTTLAPHGMDDMFKVFYEFQREVELQQQATHKAEQELSRIQSQSTQAVAEETKHLTKEVDAFLAKYAEEKTEGP